MISLYYGKFDCHGSRKIAKFDVFGIDRAGVLSVDKAAALRKPDEATRENQVEFLLDYLNRRTEKDYGHFKDSLQKDYRHLLKIITGRIDVE